MKRNTQFRSSHQLDSVFEITGIAHRNLRCTLSRLLTATHFPFCVAVKCDTL